jgi:dienelactone hydrolase
MSWGPARPGGIELDGFTRSTYDYDGRVHDVYRAGSGPGVIVIHEIPGVTPKVAAFGRRVADAGFTAVLPSLFGTPGKEPTVSYGLGQMVRACVSREFATWALGRTSPATVWCRALARDVHEELGGPGVGAVGMCLTGGFALAMMVDDHTVAPVLSQPSLPFGLTASRRAAVGLSAEDVEAVKARAAEGCDLLGLRFTGDPFVRAARFETLRTLLGDRFIGVEIDSSKGNPNGIKAQAHSVLTEDLVDEPGHPTKDALDQVLEFFAARLKG